jgi:hypothetical protein
LKTKTIALKSTLTANQSEKKQLRRAAQKWYKLNTNNSFKKQYNTEPPDNKTKVFNGSRTAFLKPAILHGRSRLATAWHHNIYESSFFTAMKKSYV